MAVAERSELAGLLAALAGLRLPPDLVTLALSRDPMLGGILEVSGVTQLWREEGREAGRQDGQLTTDTWEQVPARLGLR
ncbi:MAG TPA: hypothetical protein VGP33_16355 [Chloroflexota bacterium]|nr:hypothetical protein [Chloroflexota bacterium]